MFVSEERWHRLYNLVVRLKLNNQGLSQNEQALAFVIIQHFRNFTPPIAPSSEEPAIPDLMDSP